MMHRPRKRFGQNFLQHQPIIEKIIQSFHPQPFDNVIEIGPGLGALTQPLLQRLKQLTVIEIDTDLQAHLINQFNASSQLTIINADALTIDYSHFGEKLRVIGNLPYNISTALLLKLLHYTPFIHDMHFMLQKEVVLRLAATPKTKAYGRLSVIVQYYYDVEHLFDVPPDAFHPKPKVDSAIVRLTPKTLPLIPVVHYFDLERVVAQAFSMRRKTLANNLKPLMSAFELTNLGIDPIVRPEQLNVQQFVELTDFIANKSQPY